LIGRVIGDQVTLIRIIGDGGMGRVYEGAKQIGSATTKVAVKTLHSHLSRNPEVQARFAKECEVVAKLTHPNTIKIFASGQVGDCSYMVMEYLEGKSIRDILKSEGPMPPARVANIVQQICGSLDEAHNKHIVHRDLKPDNVIVSSIGEGLEFVKVLDFGIAGDATSRNNLTKTGAMLGTPAYMSPEQFSGKPKPDSRSDIYSLGMMTYEMLTGVLPFEVENEWAWATKHITERPTPFERPDARNRAVIPLCSKQAVMRALEKNREHRQPNVATFYNEFVGKGPSQHNIPTPTPPPIARTVYDAPGNYTPHPISVSPISGSPISGSPISGSPPSGRPGGTEIAAHAPRSANPPSYGPPVAYPPSNPLGHISVRPAGTEIVNLPPHHAIPPPYVPRNSRGIALPPSPTAGRTGFPVRLVATILVPVLLIVFTLVVVLAVRKSSSDDADESKAETWGNPCSGPCNKTPSYELQNGFYHSKDALRECYETALRSDKSLSGRIEVMTRIAHTGSVCSVQFPQDTVGSASLSSCVRSLFEKKSFPSFSSGCVDVKAPLVFEPGNNQ